MAWRGSKETPQRVGWGVAGWLMVYMWLAVLMALAPGGVTLQSGRRWR